MRRRVSWDGMDPRAGDYLTSNQAGRVFLIRAVAPLARHRPDGARLTLELDAVATAAVPAGSVLHPWQRALTSDPDGPPRVRQVTATGPTAVMSSSWRDPSDLRPNVRQPRQITGWRTYCPLRRMAGMRGAQISEQHIAAADLFRTAWDRATIGLGGEREMAALATGFGPRAGPKAADLAQTAAVRDVNRALARFTEDQRVLLHWVVLRNQSIQTWAATLSVMRGCAVNAKVEMGRLLACLDILADHYATEVETALRADRVQGIG